MTALEGSPAILTFVLALAQTSGVVLLIQYFIIASSSLVPWLWYIILLALQQSRGYVHFDSQEGILIGFAFGLVLLQGEYFVGGHGLLLAEGVLLGGVFLLLDFGAFIIVVFVHQLIRLVNDGVVLAVRPLMLGTGLLLVVVFDLNLEVPQPLPFEGRTESVSERILALVAVVGIVLVLGIAAGVVCKTKWSVEAGLT